MRTEAIGIKAKTPYSYAPAYVKVELNFQINRMEELLKQMKKHNNNGYCNMQLLEFTNNNGNKYYGINIKPVNSEFSDLP